MTEQRVFFTADTHLGHGRIIEYCNRPFTSPEEMEERMLDNFNRVLRKGDVLYVLGDLAWSSYDLGRFFGRLNTNQLHHIRGNHDSLSDEAYLKYFRWTGELKKIKVNKHTVALCHYPMRSWPAKGRGAFHLYGHCHGTIEPGIDRSMDVGVDTHDFSPWAWDEIEAELSKRPLFADTERKDVHSPPW